MSRKLRRWYTRYASAFVVACIVGAGTMALPTSATDKLPIPDVLSGQEFQVHTKDKDNAPAALGLGLLALLFHGIKIKLQTRKEDGHQYMDASIELPKK